MTDKLKLFKVRLASGAERYIVAPSGGDVWALTFSTAKSAQETGQIDEVLSVEYVHDVDGVFFREPATEPAPDGWRKPFAEMGKYEPPQAAASPTVGDACPQCGDPLHATLGQLVCSLGHQVGPVPEGTFHNHASSVDGRLTCKACQREAAESAKEKKFAEDVAKGACLHPGIFRGEVCQRCGQLAGFTPQDVAGA